eukprot:gb/GEZJ01001593.1/.p1 GENE.gb/GEZJ01001593.1/~~gb/GEZJ01001593.1/.p1  ORF type:complete len:831 (+),score=91.64 gb/GEZJ01001593.1/:2619-5111(+)
MSAQRIEGLRKSLSDALISIRIVHIDYYENPLHNYSSSTAFQAARISSNLVSDRLPVLRIFGSTPAGQGACLHIHGIRPYLYLPLPKIDPSALLAYTRELHTSLESALRAAYTPDGNPRPFIADMKPVLKHDIYGYHPSPIPFVQVFVYLPTTVQRISAIISQRALPEHLIRHHPLPYASHVPFVLQFLSDFSLAGMDYIHLSQVRFRVPLPEPPPNADVLGHYESPLDKRMFYDGLQNTNTDVLWPFSVSKRSTCVLEMDALSSQIMTVVSEKHGAYNFTSRTLAVLWDEERLRTGSYPERKQPRERAVKAGAHLSDDYMRKRLNKVLRAPVSFSPPQNRSNGCEPTATAAEEVDYVDDEFDDIVKYLDASKPTRAEEDITQFDEDPNRILHVIDGHDELPYGDDENDALEEHHTIQQTWADIAACTQTESLEQELPSSQQSKHPTFTEQTLTEDLESYVPKGINVETWSYQGTCNGDSGDVGKVQIEEGGHKCMEVATPTKLQSNRDRTPKKAGQSNLATDDDDLEGAVQNRATFALNTVRKSDGSQQMRSPDINEDSLWPNTETSKRYNSSEIQHILRPSTRPPKVLDIDQTCFTSDAFRINYETPFYGNPDDEPKTDHIYAGRRIAVRKAGARGYSPFPSSVEEDVRPRVEVLTRIVCPVQKPPRLADLRETLSHEKDGAKRSRNQRSIDIDSAGRQIRKEDTKFSWQQLTYTQSDTAFYTRSLPRANGELAKILNEGDDTSSTDDLPTSNRGNSSLVTPGEEQRHFLELNRPPSPKYDEAYQFTVHGQSHSSHKRKFLIPFSHTLMGLLPSVILLLTRYHEFHMS